MLGFSHGFVFVGLELLHGIKSGSNRVFLLDYPDVVYPDLRQVVKGGGMKPESCRQTSKMESDTSLPTEAAFSVELIHF